MPVLSGDTVSMSSRFPPLPWIALVAVLAWLPAAWAQESRGGRDGNRGGAPHGLQEESLLSLPMQPRPAPRPTRRDDALSDAVRRIERSTRGEVLSAERMQSDGRDVNRIKVVDDRGRVRVYMDDPQQRGDRPTRDDDD